MIRPATIDDLATLLALEAKAFTGDRISRRSFRHLLTKANAVVLLDEEDDRLCGYVALLFNRATSLARLYSIAVEPSCRGRRKGERLLEAAEQASRRRSCTALRLEVRPDNAAAHGLYRKGGYHNIGNYRGFYEDGADAVRLEKRLVGNPAAAASDPDGERI